MTIVIGCLLMIATVIVHYVSTIDPTPRHQGDRITKGKVSYVRFWL